MGPLLPKLKPLPIKERISIVFVEKGKIDVIDGAFVVLDKNGVREQIPIGGIACLMLEPGTRISHAAVSLSAQVGTLLVWTGEAGVRLYSSGQPGGARSDRLLWQAKLALSESARLKIVRKMYELRFKEKPPERRSIEQLRGIEGARVRTLYGLMAKRFGVKWKGRNYNTQDWGASDDINRCLSTATSCLYGITEAAILAAGFAPAVGFIHHGKSHSFVYDIADIFKFDTVIPVAFQVSANRSEDSVREVRIKCRDIFRKTKLMKRIIPVINEILSAGDLEVPKTPVEALPVAIPQKENFGDDGHRS